MRRFLWGLLPVLWLAACRTDDLDVTVIEPEDVVPKLEVVNSLVNSLVAEDDNGLNLGCFTVLYPFSLQLLDSTSVTVADEAAFELLMSDSAAQIVDFVFPLTVETQAGSTEVLVNMDDMTALFAACVPDEGWSTGDVPAFDISFSNSCYELLYPVTLIGIDGTPHEATTQAAFANLVASEPMTFDWPITLADINGTHFVAGNSDGLFELLNNCYQNGGPTDSLTIDGGAFACFIIVFPIQIQTVSGAIVDIENGDEFQSYMLSGNFASLVYPFDIITPTGLPLTANSDAQLNELVGINCETVGPNISDDVFYLLMGEGTCYNINYPVSVNMSDSTTATATGLDQFIQLLNQPDPFVSGLQYPITVTLIPSGTTEVFSTPAVLISFIENCQ